MCDYFILRFWAQVRLKWKSSYFLQVRNHAHNLPKNSQICLKYWPVMLAYLHIPAYLSKGQKPTYQFSLSIDFTWVCSILIKVAKVLAKVLEVVLDMAHLVVRLGSIKL